MMHLAFSVNINNIHVVLSSLVVNTIYLPVIELYQQLLLRNTDIY